MRLASACVSALIALALGAALGACRGREGPAGAASSASAPAAPAPPASSAGQPRPHVVLVSIDGLSAAYLDRPRPEHATTPALIALRDGGAFAPLRSVWPTQTYPAHTTLVTGVAPATHGIVANAPFDPFHSLGGAWYFYDADIRGDTLWRAARRAGLSVGNSYWPVTTGAPIDWSFPQFWKTKTKEDDQRLYDLATPVLRDEVRGLLGALPSESGTDRERAAAGVHILETRRPDLTLIYLTDLDTMSHHVGPLEAKSWGTLAAIDRELARIVEAARRLPLATIFVVSDHGFSRVHTTFHPNILLRTAGLLQSDGKGRLLGYQAAVHRGGAVCAIMLAKGEGEATKKAARRAIERALPDPKNGIAAVRDGEEIARAGGFPGAALVIEPRPGFECGSAADGKLTTPSTHAGTHGYPPSDPEMLATLIVAGHRARPGVTLPAVDMRDVAPTVAHLLGITLEGAEGQVLSAALTP